MSEANRLTCAETFGRLDDYLDRELSPEELRLVEAHLEICAVCAGEFATEREILDTIRRKVRRLAVPAALRARISAALSRESGPSA